MKLKCYPYFTKKFSTVYYVKKMSYIEPFA